MSAENEKMFRGLMQYLKENGLENMDTKELNRLTQQYINQQNCIADSGSEEPVCADDYLDLAENARSKKKKIEYLTKALELEPDDLDIIRTLIEVQSKNSSERLEAYVRLLEKGDKQMTDGGYFKNYTGDFWLVFETRPYMRVCYSYFSELVECGMMRAAVSVGKKMLKLCVNDNMGVRFNLMHVYAMLEEETPAKQLFKKYDGNLGSMMLLPMAVLYYKLNKFDIAEGYLKKLAESNKDTKKFFSAILKDNLNEYVEAMSPYGYRMNSMDELLTAVNENSYLYVSVPEFYRWGGSVLKQKKEKTPAAKKTGSSGKA